ncbi:MAG: arsenite methyltransferase, partial [Myxococcota bacterium]
APLAVLVDPFRVEEVERGGLPPDVAWLLAKQLEEADVIVTTHADESPPDVSGFLRSVNPHAPIVALDATTGDGLGRWLTARPRQLAPVLDIDYDRYAAAEALLGWANARVVIKGNQPFSPATVFEAFFAAMSDEAVAHLKVRVVVESADVEHVGHANLVRGGDAAKFQFDDLPASATSMSAIINARVATTPALLKAALESALNLGLGSAEALWSDFQAFEPGRPVPTHRYASRCGPDADGTCCAAFYQTPVVRYLLGDSFHPGGVRLTHQLAESLDLADGASLLDVACGTGASLKAIGAKQTIGAFGIDLSPPEESSDIDFRAGDVHEIPFEDERFDALLCECALSTFGDQPLALSEMFRVLKPGGVVGISDVLRDGPLDENLSEWVHYGACLGHARTLDGYADLVRSAGFEVAQVVDCEWAAKDLLQTIKKRLVGAAMAEAAGQLPQGVTINIKAGRDAVVRAQKAVTDGRVGYGFLIARRPVAGSEVS